MENVEIERKFLIDGKNLPLGLFGLDHLVIKQGYLSGVNEKYIFRLRTSALVSPISGFMGVQYFQTIKGKGGSIREEYEIEITKEQFNKLWPLCEKIVIEKKRYTVLLDDSTPAYIDIFTDKLKDLYIVEVEFDNEESCKKFVKPDWFGLEVTDDYRYTNLRLALDGIPVDFRSSDINNPEHDEFINYLESKYECVSRGGPNKRIGFASFGNTEKDIIVYERGIRGPADWFYLNKDGRFAHGGYTGYDKTFTHREFENLIIETEQHNNIYK